MKIITKPILAAISKYVAECATKTEAAKRLGISTALLSKIMHGHAQTFHDSTWEKLKPKLKPYFPSCSMGYLECPLDGGSELQELLENIIEIDDEKEYHKLNQLVTEFKDGR
ncbi:MAG: hypothetical protein RR415_11550 [Ruthenibacterium sp.]